VPDSLWFYSETRENITTKDPKGYPEWEEKKEYRGRRVFGSTKRQLPKPKTIKVVGLESLITLQRGE